MTIMKLFFILIVFLVANLSTIEGHPKNLACRVLQTGLDYMGNTALTSSVQNFILKRGSTPLQDGDVYVPGESLTYTVLLESNYDWMMDVADGGALISGGKCSGKRKDDQLKGTIIMPSSGSVLLQLGYATYDEIVSISTFNLAQPARTSVPTEAPSFLPTPLPGAPTLAPSTVQPTVDPTASPPSVTLTPTATVETFSSNSYNNPSGTTLAIGVVLGSVGLAVLFGALGYYLYLRGESDSLTSSVFDGLPVNAALGLVFAVISLVLVLVWKTDTDESREPYSATGHARYMVAMFFCCQVLALCAWSLCPAPHQAVGKGVHVLFQSLALIGMALGLWKIIQQKLDSETPQLTTLHSWLGIAAVATFCANYIWGSGMGMLKVLYPESSLHKAGRVMYLHRAVGLTALGLTMLAIETGVMGLLGGGRCYYSTYDGSNGRDTNPAANYEDLPEECKVGNGLGITVILATLFVYASVCDRLAARTAAVHSDSH